MRVVSLVLLSLLLSACGDDAPEHLCPGAT